MTLTEALDDLQKNMRKSSNVQNGGRALQIVNRALANKSFKSFDDLSKFLGRYGIERTRAGWEMPDLAVRPLLGLNRPSSRLSIEYVTLQDGTVSDVTVQNNALIKSASTILHQEIEKNILHFLHKEGTSYMLPKGAPRWKNYTVKVTLLSPDTLQIQINGLLDQDETNPQYLVNKEVIRIKSNAAKQAVFLGLHKTYQSPIKNITTPVWTGKTWTTTSTIPIAQTTKVATTIPKHEAAEAEDALSKAYLSLNALKAGYDQTDSEIPPRDQQIYNEISQAIDLTIRAKQHAHQARMMLRKSF